MYYNIFIILVIFFWFFSFFIAFTIFIIFFDRYIKKQNSNIDNALNNIITSLGVLSAIIFFSFNSITTIVPERVLYYTNIVIKIYMSFTFAFIIIYLIHSLINMIKKIINRKKIHLKPKRVDFQYSSSDDKFFSKLEWVLIVLFTFVICFLFFKFYIFNISFQ